MCGTDRVTTLSNVVSHLISKVEYSGQMISLKNPEAVEAPSGADKESVPCETQPLKSCDYQVSVALLRSSSQTTYPRIIRFMLCSCATIVFSREGPPRATVCCRHHHVDLCSLTW